ncbi:amylo-alpha-1,6-glucosidase [Aggregatilinea lenta]|uniref:amylo-alpha-1,6-glucosidase n=1 Tax=Aggregatilinea lenta TaxID=913108 RepID=UPI000E5C3225|nr:trehalase family glycosidase [Aggregatilinea lenta]
MTFDLRHVPFSRFGSYMAFSRLAGKPGVEDGLYLRSVHGGVAHQVLFRLEVIDDGTPIPFVEQASPTLLRLAAAQGDIEICMPEQGMIRIRGSKVGLRLSRHPLPTREGWVYDTVTRNSDCRWSVNVRAALRQYMVTALHGDITVDAPWNAMYCDHIQIDFQPGPDGAFECAVEEYRSSWQAHDTTDSFDTCVRAVEAEFAEWEAAQVDIPVSLSEARRMAAYVNWSCVVAPEGRLQRPTMYMSKNWMDNVWSWDHCFNALALVYKNPDLAWDQFMVMFDTQDEFGALPDYINDLEIVWNFFKPPIHGWTLRRMLERSDAITNEQLAEAYGPLSRWTNWLTSYRDMDGDGLPEYNHGNDSGWDNATVFAHGVPIEAPDLAAFLVYQMDVLADVAQQLGKPAEADEWHRRADDLLALMLSAFWRGDHFVTRHAHTHQDIQSESLLPFMPIVLGRRLPEDVIRHLVAGLTQEGRFLTGHGVATEVPSSPYYQADGYWRGPIWAPSTMLIVDGLNAVGEVELARDLSRRFSAMVARSGMAENFDAFTGDGLRDRAYSWTSSVFLILAHDYCGEME